MQRASVILPGNGRGRILGKAGAKIADIRDVSGANVTIEGNVALINGDETALKLATALIHKALKHLEASALVS